MRIRKIRSRIRRTIYRLYDFHRKNIERCKGDKIYLGRMFSLGPEFQYLLAKHLFKGVKGIRVLVDCPVSAKSKKMTIYPDIAVLAKEKGKRVLRGIIEVKYNLGWCSPKQKHFQRIYHRFFKAGEGSYKIRDENNYFDKKVPIKIPRRNIFKFAVVLMKVNDHGRYGKFKESMKKAGFKTVLLLKDEYIGKIHKGLKKNVKMEIARNKDIKIVNSQLKKAGI